MTGLSHVLAFDAILSSLATMPARYLAVAGGALLRRDHRAGRVASAAGIAALLRAAAVAALAYGAVARASLARTGRHRRLLYRRARAAPSPSGSRRRSRRSASDSDMVRYLWDGRVQQLGYNPYAVMPADPALAHTHTRRDRRRCRAAATRTPYPPAAQLFFRLRRQPARLDAGDEARARRLRSADDAGAVALAAVHRPHRNGSRSPMPGIRWSCSRSRTAATSTRSARCGSSPPPSGSTRRRTALASLAFVLAVATKLLPIVLVPLFLGRIRRRDVIARRRAAWSRCTCRSGRGRHVRSAPCRTSSSASASTARSSRRLSSMAFPRCRGGVALRPGPVGGDLGATAAGRSTIPRPGHGRWRSRSPARR